MTAQRVPGNIPDHLASDAILIRPRDPLVLRDARPFSAEPGARAFCLPWPLPRTVAGTLRTHIGNCAEPRLDWNLRADADRARRSTVSHGPLMVGQDTTDGEWHAYVPAPRDVVFYRTPDDESNELKAMVLRPQSVGNGEGCDLPEPPVSPGTGKALANLALRPLAVTEDVKPEHDLPAWWRLDDAVTWLNTTAIDPPGSSFPYAGPDPKRPDEPRTLRGVNALPTDTRVHVSIDAGTLTNVEGALFTTEALAFRDAPVPASPSEPATPALGMLCKVGSEIAWNRDEALVPLGGERRSSSITVNDPKAPWPAVTYPTEEEFANANGLRLLLVTPALFRYGWLPAWLADGTIPGLRGLKVGVKLVGAAIDRRIPVSGWRLARREPGDGRVLESGPRATRYAVPAGGVYFFTFTKGNPDPETWKTVWNHLWLRPLSDHGIDRDEGFGLVLPGLWHDEETERDTAQP